MIDAGKTTFLQDSQKNDREKERRKKVRKESRKEQERKKGRKQERKKGRKEERKKNGICSKDIHQHQLQELTHLLPSRVMLGRMRLF